MTSAADPTAARWQHAVDPIPVLIGRDLFVGRWHCTSAARTVHHEVSLYLELGFQREGTHVRALGRDRRLVDLTVATLNAVGDEIAVTSNGPQRQTSIFVRGAVAAELDCLSHRFARVSPAAARLHARMLGAHDPVAIEEAALALVHRVAADVRSSAPRHRLDVTPARRVLAEEAQHVIATRFAERLTVEDIAAACGVSPFYASRVFRAVTGETLHHQLTRVRLLAALFELRHAAGNLTDLALAVGFSSHSHFTRAFRSEFGIAPTSAQGECRDGS